MPGPAAFRTLKQTARNLVTDPPQVVREIPGRTVRVAVIGVGRALLLADRVRDEYKEVRREGVGSTVTRLRSEGVAAFGRGGAGRSGTAPAVTPTDEAAPQTGAPQDAPPVVERPAAAPPATETAAAEREPGTAETPGPSAPGPSASQPTAADLPVPNYDDLSAASLRARLRNLSVDQVEQLRDYEKAHADRKSVVTMYDNRIAKLRAEQ